MKLQKAKTGIRLGLMLLMGCNLSSSLVAQDTPERPNVLFILSDDHSVPFLGAYGYPVETPNLDAMAEKGILFHGFHTNAPQCVPSRAALMTGQAPSAIRMSRFSSPLPPNVPTLPGLLQKNGYYTGVCGRTYHLDGSGGPWREMDAADKVIAKHGLAQFKNKFDFIDVSEGLDDTHTLLGQFLDQKPADKPFFLWINFQDPHFPFPGSEYTGVNPPDKIEVPAFMPDMPSVRQALADHLDEVTHLDVQVGRILEMLKAKGQEENTLIIFMGDNGSPFLGGKGSLRIFGLNVPAIAYWPGITPKGAQSRELISGEDLMPTILELAQVEAPAGLRSKSFAPILRGEKFDGREFIYGERGSQGIAPETTPKSQQSSMMFDLARSVRSENWNLICNYTPHQIYAPVDTFKLAYWHEMNILYQQGRLAPEFGELYFTNPRPVWKLYNLKDDPNELNNVYGKAGTEAITAKLKEALLENMILNYDFLPLALPDESKATGSGH